MGLRAKDGHKRANREDLRPGDIPTPPEDKNEIAVPKGGEQ